RYDRDRVAAQGVARRGEGDRPHDQAGERVVDIELGCAGAEHEVLAVGGDAGAPVGGAVPVGGDAEPEVRGGGGQAVFEALQGRPAGPARRFMVSASALREEACQPAGPGAIHGGEILMSVSGGYSRAAAGGRRRVKKVLWPSRALTGRGGRGQRWVGNKNSVRVESRTLGEQGWQGGAS